MRIAFNPTVPSRAVIQRVKELGGACRAPSVFAPSVFSLFKGLQGMIDEFR